MKRFLGYTSQLNPNARHSQQIVEVIKGPEIEKIREFQSKSQNNQINLERAAFLGRAKVVMDNPIKKDKPNSALQMNRSNPLNLKLARENNVYSHASNNYARWRDMDENSRYCTPRRPNKLPMCEVEIENEHRALNQVV